MLPFRCGVEDVVPVDSPAHFIGQPGGFTTSWGLAVDVPINEKVSVGVYPAVNWIIETDEFGFKHSRSWFDVPIAVTYTF